MTYALITGGSKGIGKEIAIQLAKKGKNLLLVARSKDELERTKAEITSVHNVKVDVFPCDLSVKGAAKSVFNWCVDQKYDVDTLINNAGYGLWGYFDTMTLESQLDMMQVNMNALVELTYLFLPQLKSKTKAYILNVASTAAYQAVPAIAVYAASKIFVLNFTRGLRFELKGTPVSISCLSPGTTTTNFTTRAGMQAMQALADKFTMPADVVAKTAVDGMYKGKAEIIPGLTNIVSVIATYYLPKSIIEGIAANLYLKHINNKK